MRHAFFLMIIIVGGLTAVGVSAEEVAWKLPLDAKAICKSMDKEIAAVIEKTLRKLVAKRRDYMRRGNVDDADAIGTFVEQLTSERQRILDGFCYARPDPIVGTWHTSDGTTFVFHDDGGWLTNHTNFGGKWRRDGEEVVLDSVKGNNQTFSIKPENGSAWQWNEGGATAIAFKLE